MTHAAIRSVRFTPASPITRVPALRAVCEVVAERFAKEIAAYRTKLDAATNAEARQEWADRAGAVSLTAQFMADDLWLLDPTGFDRAAFVAACGVNHND